MKTNTYATIGRLTNSIRFNLRCNKSAIEYLTVQACAAVMPNSFRHLLAKHLLSTSKDPEIILKQVQHRATTKLSHFNLSCNKSSIDTPTVQVSDTTKVQFIFYCLPP